MKSISLVRFVLVITIFLAPAPSRAVDTRAEDLQEKASPFGGKSPFVWEVVISRDGKDTKYLDAKINGLEAVFAAAGAKCRMELTKTGTPGSALYGEKLYTLCDVHGTPVEAFAFCNFAARPLNSRGSVLRLGARAATKQPATNPFAVSAECRARK